MKLNAGFVCSLAVALLAGATNARAASVSGTLGVTYFEVLNGTGGPDFGGSGTPNVANGSALGPDGLPVVNSASPGITEFNSTTHEITWWSPAMNSAVLSTGTGVAAIPYSSNMYQPNSGGGNDATAYETAILNGSFTLSSTGAVHFTVGSDDDAFIYLNGILIGQNPGIHGVTDVTFTGSGLAGSNSLEIFYADRERTGAFLDVSADVALTGGVPETSTWAMMILGFAGVGFMAYRRKSRPALMAA